MSYPFFAPAVRCKVVNWDFDAFSFLQLPQDVDEQLKVEGIRVVKVILILSCELLLFFTQHLTHKHSADEKQDINLFIQSMSFESYVSCKYYKSSHGGWLLSPQLEFRNIKVKAYVLNTEIVVKSWESYAWCSKRHFIQEMLMARFHKVSSINLHFKEKHVKLLIC